MTVLYQKRLDFVYDDVLQIKFQIYFELNKMTSE